MAQQENYPQTLLPLPKIPRTFGSSFAPSASIAPDTHKYDNIRRKAFNDINEVDNIKLPIGNKVEKLKLFFAEGFLKALNIFGQFLMTAFESRKETVEIRRN